MVYDVIVSKKAQDSLKEIVQYISEKNSPQAAEKVRSRLIQVAIGLEKNPRRFSREPYFDQKAGEIRSAIQWRYKIVYEIVDKEVRILNFFHTSQHPGKIDHLK